MFERFAAAFVPTSSGRLGERWDEPRLLAVTGYAQLAEVCAGRSFDGGLYRVHDATTGPGARASIAEAFPEFAERALPFAYDWLGRQFAVDSARIVGGEPEVLLLEPGTGEALEIPLPLVAFHDDELVEYADAALARSFWSEWAQGHPESLPLRPDQCVGYKVPLFMGGQDVVDNLELSDIDVYWSVCGQLRRGIHANG